jgi:hypothetical protein
MPPVALPVRRRLLTLNETADYLGRSVKAVRALVNKGRLQSVRIDYKVQFDIHDLDRLIQDSKVRWDE